VDASTGLETAWNPAPSSAINVMRKVGNTLYVGGLFTNIGAQPRNRLAAIDLLSQTPAAWNPDVNSSVMDILPAGNTIYVSGAFTTVGLDTRKSVAAIDATTGLALAFAADANDYISSLALDGNILYCGGNLTTSFTLPRNRCAAFDATSGALLSWAPGVTSASVEAMCLLGGNIYLGGYFFGINSVPFTPYFGAVDAAGANVAAFAPRAGGPVRDLLCVGSRLYVGGAFGYVTWEPYSNLVAIDTAPVVGVGPGRTPALSTLRVYPNPATTGITVDFTLPAAGETTVAVYDVAGRRVRTLHAGATAAGPRTIMWDGRDSRGTRAPAGVYFVRVHHAGTTANEKITLVR
jgi:hypothetical protein